LTVVKFGPFDPQMSFVVAAEGVEVEEEEEEEEEEY
jgi:hypothetical protein